MITENTERSAFIEQNLGLVHSCAGRFRGRGIEYDDLYSAGCMGLVKAYDAFDPARGVCFPPTRCRSSSARSRSCSGMGAQSR